MADVTVWYDGACPLCRREIDGLSRLDRRGTIHFIDISEETSHSCPISQKELMARFHARKNGRLLSGAAAFAAMWRAIPLLRPLAELARIPLVLQILEWSYRRFLIVRPYLQRLIAGTISS